MIPTCELGQSWSGAKKPNKIKYTLCAGKKCAQTLGWRKKETLRSFCLRVAFWWKPALACNVLRELFISLVVIWLYLPACPADNIRAIRRFSTKIVFVRLSNARIHSFLIWNCISFIWNFIIYWGIAIRRNSPIQYFLYGQFDNRRAKNFPFFAMCISNFHSYLRRASCMYSGLLSPVPSAQCPCIDVSKFLVQ